MITKATVHHRSGHNRKRPVSHQQFVHEEENSSSSAGCLQDQKRYARNKHRDIEKRRRKSLNSYIHELSTLLSPQSTSLQSKKIDKLTVLKLTLQYLKNANRSDRELPRIPHFSALELQDLLGDSFLFAISCQTGQIVFVSQSVAPVLHQSSDELIGTSFFNALHHADVAKVKEQIQFSDEPTGRSFMEHGGVAEAAPSSQHPITPFQLPDSGETIQSSHRSFMCRMKRIDQVQSFSQTTLQVERGPSYSCVLMHCAGFVKAFPRRVFQKLGFLDNIGTDHIVNLMGHINVFVGVARLVVPLQSTVSEGPYAPHDGLPLEFTCRLTSQAKFLEVDERCQCVVGYQPQELIGLSFYTFIHQDDVHRLAESHKLMLRNGERSCTQICRFIRRDGKSTPLQTFWQCFRSPFAKQVDFIMANITTIPPISYSSDNYGFFHQRPSGDQWHGHQSNPVARTIENVGHPFSWPLYQTGPGTLTTMPQFLDLGNTGSNRLPIMPTSGTAYQHGLPQRSPSLPLTSRTTTASSTLPKKFWRPNF